MLRYGTCSQWISQLVVVVAVAVVVVVTVVVLAGKQRQVWLTPIADERVGVQVKL